MGSIFYKETKIFEFSLLYMIVLQLISRFAVCFNYFKFTTELIALLTHTLDYLRKHLVFFFLDMVLNRLFQLPNFL